MISTLPYLIVLISVLVFALVLVGYYALFERSGSGAANEPLVQKSEPNRRNQSAAPFA